MAVPLNINIVAAVKARLVDALDEYIVDANAVFADESGGVTADQPQKILDYLPHVAELTAFPVIGVGEGPITFEDDTGWSATARSQISVVMFVRSNERRVLSWKLRVLASAVVGCVLHDRNPGTSWGVMLRSVEPGPVLRTRDSPSPNDLLGIRACLFEVREEQDNL